MLLVGTQPKARPLRELTVSAGAGPGDIFPLSASTQHRKDNEIFILSDVRPHGQGGVTGSFNDHTIQVHRLAVKGGHLSQSKARQCSRYKREPEVGIRKLCRGPHGFSKVPWELAVSTKDQKVPTSPPYPSSPLSELLLAGWCHSRPNKM